MTDLLIESRGPLRGSAKVPGDKSISHRSVMLSAIALGDTVIEGLLFSDDVLATARAFTDMGVEIELDHDKLRAKVGGRGPFDLESPRFALDLGNSGTSMRLLAGLLSGLPVEALLIGDKSLMKRPMGRIIEPLRMMGADIAGSKARTAPLMIKGGGLVGIDYELPVASAQLKSAVLLAGLHAEGETVTREPGPARDHTERMLPLFGARVRRDGPMASVSGESVLRSPGRFSVPGDISSAAFLIVAALTVPGSELLIEGVGINPTRTGLLEMLEQMGARLELRNERDLGEEPVADIFVAHSELRGISIGGDLVTRGIDEIPALCVAAARALGKTEIRDAAELRVKESDRLAAMSALLKNLGVRVEEKPDGMVIYGSDRLEAAVADPGLDHRVAMAAAVAGLSARGKTVVKNAETISSSFPGFGACLTALAG